MQETTQAQGKDGAVKVLDSVSITNGQLHVHVTLTKGTPSSTGKSTVHASTGGFKRIEGTEYSYSLLVIRKA